MSADGLGDFPTIQAAVDAVVDGDIIELTDEVFTGDGNRDIEVPAVNITIRSQGGNPMVCYVDCEGTARAEHRGFHFTSTGSGNATLQGVGVLNGYTTADGGAGMWIDGASPTLEDCLAVSCSAVGVSVRGGGLYVSGQGNPTVTRCVFTGNDAGYGGGVAVHASGGTYDGCEINDNSATDVGGGFYGQFFGGVTITDCFILGNDAGRAGGLRVGGSGGADVNGCNISRNEATSTHSGGIWLQTGVVTDCTIVGNSAATFGGGVYCSSGTGSLVNCVIAFSGAGEGVAADWDDVPTLTCCDVYGNAGGNYDVNVGDQTGLNGNISEDPQLCGLGIGDYRLHDTSPCLPGGNGCSLLLGAFGQGCDSPVEETSWGSVKGMWR